MNFPFDPSKAQQQPGMNQQTPVAGSQGFTAGTTGAGDAGKMTGFTLPSMQTQGKPNFFGSTLGGTPTLGSQAAPPTVGQSLGLGAPTSQTPGLTFGTPSTQATSLNFSMGGASTGAATGFGATAFTGAAGAPGTLGSSATTGGATFSVPKPAATPASSTFTLGASAASTPAANAPKLTFGAGAAAASTPANQVFSLGGSTAPAATATPATGTSFGLTTPAASAAQATGLTLGATTSGSGFSLPASNAGTQQLGFGQTTPAAAAATTASTGFTLQGTTSTPLASGFTLGSSSAAPTISTGFTLNKTTAAQVASSTAAAVATTNTPQTSLGTVTTVSSAATGQAGTMNFCQLEESINKWTLELEEQEKAFVNQATQVNNWDKLLIANGEKITTLNQEVERVKLEQHQLEQELDYVVGQQKELQDCLIPLEKELASLSVADPERDYTYRLAENLDKQLKTMSQDLKEIIEHLNEANRSQDSSDPIVQIGKILNAHMNSLQWLDQRTSVLGQKIQQIDQMHQNFRQENERSFSLAYN